MIYQKSMLQNEKFIQQQYQSQGKIIKMQIKKIRPKTSNLSTSFHKKHKPKYKIINTGEVYTYSSQYSQNILTVEEKASKKDYLNQNRKNLKNFFKDRIPKSQLPIYSSKQKFSNSKIYQYRRKQIEKQEKTSFSMHNSFQLNKIQSKPQIIKIDQSFNINDKTRQLKQKYQQQSQGFIYFGNSSYKSGTQSSIKKASKILKKEAYQSVFGKDKSEVIQNNRFYKKQSSMTKALKKSKKSKKRMSSVESQIPDKVRDKYKILLNKISKYNIDFKSNQDYVEILNQNEEQRQLNDDKEKEEIKRQKDGIICEENMINWIKQLSHKYKLNSVEKVGELKKKKDNSHFFREMKKHKENRLRVRRIGLESNYNSSENEQEQQSYLKYDTKIESQDDDDTSILITASARMRAEKLQVEDEIDFNQKQIDYKHLTRQKFIKFGRHLIQSLRIAKVFGIEKDRIFQVFWLKRSPFELEGSYAFFKAIKNNQIEMVKNFVQRNQNYLYQIDKSNRSPLIYSAINQRSEILKYIISKGVNIEHKCSNYKTALYYGLVANNSDIVKQLLQAGSNPWSTKTCSYSLKNSSRECRILFKNARKINIVYRMMPHIKEKEKFWSETKQKIHEKGIFSFI